MPLRILFTVNAVAMLAAGIVLFVSPRLIPAVIGVDLPPGASILSALLGAAELGLAVLCLQARSAREPSLQRAAVWTCIVFHGASGIAELVAYGQGARAVVLWNVAVRVVMVALFVRYGLWPAAPPLRLSRRPSGRSANL